MQGRPFRIIFMGTPDFAVPTLKTLIKGPDHIVAVVSQPDRPKGRGRRLVAPAVKTVALEHQIPVLQPLKIRTREFLDALKQFAPDVIIVAAYGRILPPAILSLPAHGCINVHGSLLPRHRGAAPIQWSIIEGDEEVGVTIMQMDEGLDTGDILLRKAIVPEPDETSGSLFPKIAELGGQAVMDTLDMLAEGGLAFIHQDDRKATLAPMLSKQDGLLDWNQPAKKLHNLIRGLDPWPRAFCMHGSSKLQLFNPEVVFENSSLPPGTVIRADREGVLISTKEFCLLVKEVQPEGKKRMRVEAFLNGHQLNPGDRLTGK